MDPNETLKLIEEVMSHDPEQTEQLADDLREWIRNGGFHPSWIDHPEASRFYARHTNDYSPVTHKEFTDHLYSVIDLMEREKILEIPGVEELCREHLNNEVLASWLGDD